MAKSTITTTSHTPLPWTGERDADGKRVIYGGPSALHGSRLMDPRTLHVAFCLVVIGAAMLGTLAILHALGIAR